MAIKLLNFQLRENKPYDNPDYKYELGIDTNNAKLISRIINSTSLVETDNETGVTLYANNKQELLTEKQAIEQLCSDQITDKQAHSTPNTELAQKWHNPVLEQRFQALQQLVKQGWRIELETIDQTDNGYWHFDPVTKLPYPDQKTNRFGDLPPVTYTTYVYPPKSNDFIDDLQASFNTPLEAYQWLIDKQHLPELPKSYTNSRNDT